MCCRYFWDESMLSEVMYDYPDAENLIPPELMRRKQSRDVLPTEQAPVLRAGRSDGLLLTRASWGFPYAHEGQRKLAINARSESAASKRLFSQAMHEARCAVPVTAFYEYAADKQKVRFDGERPVLYLAGCMQAEHFVILTKEPDAVVAPVHDRMPLIIGKEDVEEWICAKNVPSRLMQESTCKLTSSMQYKQMSLFD